MYPATSLVLCDLLVVHVWSLRKPDVPHVHPNVTSGDLLDYSDYPNSVTPLSGMPAYLRRDSNGNIVVRLAMHYGAEDKIVGPLNDTLLVTKKKNPEANLSEIWHINQDDHDLKLFFANVLEMKPADVTVVHMLFSKKESIKKVLIKERLFNAHDILYKIKLALAPVI